MQRRLSVALASGLALLSVACRTIADPNLPAHAVLFEPLAQYRLWWELTSQCAGVSRSFDDVQWYLVPGVSSFPTEQGPLGGAYYRAQNRIVLAELVSNTAFVVRHEMLHALLRIDVAHPAHPATYFQRRCAGIVNCEGPCAQEIDMTPSDTGAILVAPAQLSLDLALYPASGRLRDSGGWYVAVASVTNQRSIPVRVALPPKGLGRYLSFAYTDDCVTVTNLSSSSSIDLAPRETRYYAFDQQWCRVEAGLLTARASLGGDSTAVRHWTIQP
jgi:hypothetical protein